VGVVCTPQREEKIKCSPQEQVSVCLRDRKGKDVIFEDGTQRRMFKE
jgi:hypothetical protein